jgi:ribonuclease G
VKKQVLVSVDAWETRVALLEQAGTPAKGVRKAKGSQSAVAGYRVAELYVERRGSRSIVGNIYKGRVDNVLDGLEAAFIDIGLEKNGFLHIDEIVLPGVEIPRRGRGQEGGKRISEILKPGMEVVVQVVKDPLKTKGARLSMDLTIAGRYMVYTPTGEGLGVSKRLEDKERDRLRKQVKGLDLKGGGAIVRTAAHGAKHEDFERELPYLFKLHEVLQQRAEAQQAPSLVFQEADLSVRVVRDIFSADFERAIVDDEKQHHRLVSFFTRTAPELVDRVELHQGSKPLLEEAGVEEVIAGLTSRRVDLPSGGYLMIDYAEALTVFDVNSGSFVGRGKQARLEDTITKTNLEAADEVVRQLRLRDIGGIIVIDFIDMARARNREAVLKTLRAALDQDRTKTFTAEISKLGLVEMTRQNVTEGVREIISRTCPTCDGDGVVLSEETVAMEFDRRLRELAARAPRSTEAFLVQMNPSVSIEFTGLGARMLHELEAATSKVFHFEGTDSLALDHFTVVMEGTAEEVHERAVPFSPGEEVLVSIVEPHMYNVDDAVAKIDGYVVSVSGGGAFIGQKRLVRIEDAGRNSARATLLGDEGPKVTRAPRKKAESGAVKAAPKRAAKPAKRAAKPAPKRAAKASDEAADEVAPEPAVSANGDALESKPRRRGRRGGRRRSAATADAGPGTDSTSD